MPYDNGYRAAYFLFKFNEVDKKTAIDFEF